MSLGLVKYNKSTGIYKSRLTDALIDCEGSIFDFIFSYAPKTPDSRYDNPKPVKRRAWEERKDAVWLVDALTGRTLTAEQSLARSEGIARALFKGYGVGTDDVLGVFSGNEVDFACATWGAFRLGAIVSCANPSYGAEELAFQLSLVGEHHPVKCLLVAPDTLEVASQAVASCGLSKSIIVLIAAPGPAASEETNRLAKEFPTLDQLVAKFANVQLPPVTVLKDGENKKKVAFLSFSSGTTGRPKACVIPHYSLIANVLQTAHQWDSTGSLLKSYDAKTGSGDKVLAVLPFFHIYGLVVVLHCSIFMDTPVVTLNKFTLADFLGSVQRHKITTIYVVPPIVILLVNSPLTANYDLSSLRIGMTGAAPLTEEISVLLSKKFPKLIFGQGYGMTETCTIISIFDARDPFNIPRASAGVFAPNIEAKVVSPEGKTLGFGEIGELLSKSPSNAAGYLGNQKATDETFDKDGFVHTGDEVYVSKEGWLYVVDRIKELIKVSGNQVAPAELEGHLLGHPDVRDVCVIGIPHDFSGEVPKAFVALSDEAVAAIAKDPKESDRLIASIKKFVADKKIKYKHLGEVQFLDAIPKTASGKLLRKDLRVLHATEAKAKKAKL